MMRLLLNAFQAVAAVAVISRLSAGAQREEALSPDDARKGETPGVSVVIPARNEEGRITDCLLGLAGQRINEILVIDDASSDSTAEIAVKHGATVKRLEQLPEGWVGKPAALDLGLREASSEWVLFLDADTRPLPVLIDVLMARAATSKAHVISLSARFSTNTPFQQSLHASFLSGFIYRFGPVGTKRPTAVDRTVINGQCFLVRRDWLLNQGGFALSSGHMTDDIALAQGLAARGAHIEFLDGSKVLEVQMYESGQETWVEWGRSLPMADVLSTKTRLIDVATLWLTQVLPLIRVLTRRLTPVDIALLTTRFALLIPMAQAFRRPNVGLALSPLLDPATVLRLTWALFKPSKSWRGRTYEGQQTTHR